MDLENFYFCQCFNRVVNVAAGSKFSAVVKVFDLDT